MIREAFPYEVVGEKRYATLRSDGEAVDIQMFPRLRVLAVVLGTWFLMQLGLFAAIVVGVLMDWPMGLILSAAMTLWLAWHIGYFAWLVEFRRTFIARYLEDLQKKQPDAAGFVGSMGKLRAGMRWTMGTCRVEFVGGELRVYASEGRMVFRADDLQRIRGRSLYLTVPGLHGPQTVVLQQCMWRSRKLSDNWPTAVALRDLVTAWKQESPCEQPIYPPLRVRPLTLRPSTWYRTAPALFALMAAAVVALESVAYQVGGAKLGMDLAGCAWFVVGTSLSYLILVAAAKARVWASSRKALAVDEAILKRIGSS